MCIYISVSVFLYSYVRLSIFFSFLRHFFVFNLLSCRFYFWFLVMFPFVSISFAFGPFLLSCLLCGFHSASVSSLLSPSPSSSFPFLFFLLALSSFPMFIFLLPRFLLSFLLPPALPFFPLAAPTPSPPPPSSVPLIPSSVFSCFSALLFPSSFSSLPLFSHLFVFYCFLVCLFFSSSFLSSSYSTVFSFVSSFPLPSSSGSLLLSFLRLFLSYLQFLPFLLLSLYRLFLSLTFLPPSLPFLLLFSLFLWVFVSLSVISCSFFRFPFACFCVLELGNLVFRFFLALCFCLCSYGLSFVFLSLAFLPSCLPSTSLPLQLVFLRRLYSSAVRLSSAGGSLSLSTYSPSPTPSSAGYLASFFLLLRSLSASFLRFLSDSSPLVVVLFLSLSLSLAFSFLCLFSVIGNAVQGCLSVQFDLGCRLLFLSSGFVFYATERGGVSCVVRFL